MGRERGVELVQVVEGSPAAHAGLRPEDLIIDIDAVPVEGVDDLQRMMTGEAIGRTVQIRVYRDGRILSLELTPVELAT